MKRLCRRTAALAALVLTLSLALCACAPGGAQPSSPPPEASAHESDQGSDPTIRSWDEVSWDGHMELKYAEGFSVDYAGSFKRVTIGSEVYVVAPEGVGGLPFLNMPEDVTVLYQPLENIYLQATSAMDCVLKLDALEAVTLSGTQADGWYIEEARQAMEEGRIAYAGKYSAPDYELIQSKGCGLALMSNMISHAPEVKEQLERLGVPVLVERSSYENHPLGRMEWIKLYGALLNREEEAASYFDGQLAKLEPVLEREGTGKTAAFFSISSDGTVSVRKSGDYIAQSIALAGGIYVPQGLEGGEGSLSMETFYAGARDADILIYNSTVEADLDTIEQLVSKSAVLAEFKAVREGNVWCTGKSMFQESQSVGEMILDFHRVLTQGADADGSLTYLRRLT